MDRNGRQFALALLLNALWLIGCGEKPPDFGQVTGSLTAKGKPLKDMIVTFMPDPAEGNDLPYNASGQTDEKGAYQLRYSLRGLEGEGAALGWNRVLITDTRFGSVPQGQPPPPRLFSPDYSRITSTPLKFEVKPGPQTIDIELK